MNYRHAFHAGNFADLVKHASLLRLIERLHKRGALSVLDTHAGAGLYDLTAEAGRRSGEGHAALTLMAETSIPASLAPLRDAIAKLAGATLYPGSPLLVAQSLRHGDSLLACELQAGDREALADVLAAYPQARVSAEDGYVAARDFIAKAPAVLALIDPPFERPDDYDRAAQAARDLLAHNPGMTVLVWTPLKDLETFDAFVRRLAEGARAPLLAVQTRLRPLSQPMRLNGCALCVFNPPDGLETEMMQIADWVAQRFGEAGGGAVAERA